MGVPMGRALRLVILPAAFYLAAFAVLTWPAPRSFSTHFFHGGGDGWYNVWTLWWFDRAVTVLHQSPLETPLVRHPHGTRVVGLEIWNGLLGIPLQRALGLLRAHNTLVVLSFVGSGLAAFWLCRRAAGVTGPALVGGYVFAFSSYRFAHAEGHLGLLSTHGLPVFTLLALRFVSAPGVAGGVAAALALAFVLYSNAYYFLFCLATAVLLALWRSWRAEDRRELLRREHRAGLVAFLLAALATCGPLLAADLVAGARDPLEGTPDRRAFSLDLPALVVPGGHWRFAELTRPYWSALPGNIHESSVSLGVAVLVLAACGWKQRRSAPGGEMGLWWLLLWAAVLLALGPGLRVFGRELAPLPQQLFYERIPLLRPFSAPVRFVVLAALAVSVLAAWGVRVLWGSGTRGRAAAGLLVALMALELWPRPLSLMPPGQPAFVEFLRAQTGPGAVADTVSSRWDLLYHQTAHGRPILFGLAARLPRSVLQKDARLLELLQRRDYAALRRDHGFRFLVLAPDVAPPAAPLVYRDERAAVYDLP
jgi:hypothetical protein